MNLPNKLTMLRIIMVPFMVVFLLVPGLRQYNGDMIALIIFIAASLTDMLDGYIARKYDLITDFGKFMDPLADKLLVCSAMICLIERDMLNAWVVIVLISREFIISGIRLIAAEKGVVVAANIFGKLKTVVQMLMIIYLMGGFFGGKDSVGGQILIYASVVFAVVSLVIYIVQNRSVLMEAET